MERYIYIHWPESQKYIELDEAIIDVSEDGARINLLVPEKYILNNEYIVQTVKELSKLYEATEAEIEGFNKEFEKAFAFEGGMSITEHILNIQNSL